MSFGAVHHVGVVVPELESVRLLLERAGVGVVDEPVAEPALGIEVMWAHLDGLDLEFVRPLHDDTRAARVLADGEGGLHHVAFAVEDLDAELDRLAGDDVGTVGPPRDGVSGSRIAFLDPAATGGTLIELVEPRTGGPVPVPDTTTGGASAPHTR
ncbi:VOC family protein [Patulibacter sp. NPDC049589]|uniref:VOC family protein n=1 Tax=Patulibacter sp. NPDC049589 TaxID=3154731 RepID=UPI003426E61C